EEEEGALALAEAAAAGALSLPAAEVVAILHRDPRDIVVCLSHRDEVALRARMQQQQGAAVDGGGGGGPQQPQRRSELLLCLPLDRRLPPVAVVTRQGGALLGCRFVVRVDAWERHSRYPRGHMTRVLGRLNDLRAESEAVLVQCGIVNKPFCEAALAELPRISHPSDWRVPPAERAARRDLTGPDFFVVSIDPVGCTDVDDAMHVRFLEDPTTTPATTSSASSSFSTVPGVAATAAISNITTAAAAATVGKDSRLVDADTGAGGVSSSSSSSPGSSQLVEVGVHIADVSWFVPPGGMLDGEARERATSVYLVDRRLDMLPGLLSEQLASLREGVERLAVSVVWTLRRSRRSGSGSG
ncbi:hypothetical protein Agub_g8572, partial [Astrephomene gubernaculifera]